MTRLVVVGLDGAGFELLQPWLNEGELPMLSRLIRDGCRADLESVQPPVTCPSWRCYSTGVNPGKHGVFWWEQVDRDSNSFTVPTSADFDAPDVWDYLGDDGHKSAVINMPTTFPPEEIDGWMISGGGGVDGNEFTYPPELQREIEQQFDYEVFIPGSSGNIGDNPDRVEQVLELIDTRFAAAEYVRDEYDPAFLSLVIFYTNVFHHFFWDDEVTKRVWKRIDDHLADFLDDENVLLISDHGSNQIHNVFNVNAWLEETGYLVTDGSVSDHLYDVGITRKRITEIVDKLGLKNKLKRLLPHDLVTLFPREDGSVVGQGKAEKIDWERSTAFASGQGPVYVLTDNEAERERVSKQLKSELRKLQTPDKRPVARAVHDASEVYEGPYVAEGPDLLIEQADNIHIDGALGRGEVFDRPEDWRAENHRDGILVASGPDVATECRFEEQPQIYDLAPTILHWLGCQVPSYLDGRVLTELFDEGSDPGTRSVDTVSGSLDVTNADDSADQEQMRDRLKDLGYLSE